MKEIRPTVEALVNDGIAVAKWVGERAIHGAWGTLASLVHAPQENNNQGENNVNQ